MKIDDNTKVSELQVELVRLGVHSVSHHRAHVPLDGTEVVVSVGFIGASGASLFAYGKGSDLVAAYNAVLDKVERGIADEVAVRLNENVKR